MPRRKKPMASFKVLRERYVKGLQKGFLTAIYRAYSRWNEKAYFEILRQAPISKTPSDRFPTGFVKSHIKLVTKKRPPYIYQEVSVPGKSNRGSRAWRAWMAIRMLHFGFTSLPVVRKPTRKKALAIPYYPGRRVPRSGQTTIVVKKTIQTKQPKLNPFIARAWKTLEPDFPVMLKEEIRKEPKVKKKSKGELK